MNKCAIALSIGVSLSASPVLAGDGSEVKVEISASGVAASGQALDGNEDEDRSGGIFSGTIGWDLDRGKNRVQIDYSSAYYNYTDNNRNDRWRNRFAASYGHELSDELTLSVRGDLTSRASTLEFREVDQLQLRGRIAYQSGPWRIRTTAGWRWREYHDVGRTNGEGVNADGDIRFRLGRRHYLMLDVRYEEIDATNTRRSYHRTTLYGEYKFPLSKKIDIEAGLRWKKWSYPGRLVGGDNQRDNSIAPELRVTYDLGDGWEAEVGGTVIDRNSNDDRFDETIKRGMFTIRKEFTLIK